MSSVVVTSRPRPDFTIHATPPATVTVSLPGAGQGDSGGDLQQHIDSPTPHPAYDDMPDLTLFFEGALL